MNCKSNNSDKVNLRCDARDEALPLIKSWLGKWIWLTDRGDGKFDFICFRKVFSLQSKLNDPVIHITAEREYILWINGQFVGRGPSLSDPRFKRYDTFRIKNLLKSDENVISVLVYHHSEKDGSCRLAPYQESCGLLCQIDDGNENLLASDQSWRVARHTGWKRTENIRFDDSSFPEWYDAGAFPQDWNCLLFDDSRWNFTITCIPPKHLLWGGELPQTRFFPWVNLISSETTTLKLLKRLPESVSFGEVLQRREFTFEDTAVRMSLEHLMPCKKTGIQNAHKLCEPGEKKIIVYNSDPYESEDSFDGYHNATIILDFGKLMNARFGFKLKSQANTKIDIGYSWNLEDGRVIPYVSCRTPQADCYVSKEGGQTWQTYQWRHFRYVQITFRDVFQPLEIVDIWAEEVEYLFPMGSSFTCDNDLLNRSWQATENTVKLCCTDQTMDNPSRERKQYLGDCSAIIPAIDHLFGQTALVKKYFHQFDESQHATGLYRYSTNYDDDKSSLFDHSLSLPIRLHEHYMKFSDKELLLRMFSGIRSFMSFSESILNDDGIAVLPPYALFFDWAFLERKNVSFLLNAMVAKAFCASADIAQWANSRDGVDIRWRQKGERIFKFLHENFYDKERGVFVDCLLENGRQEPFVSEHSNSLAVLWGIADFKQTDSIMNNYSKEHNMFSAGSPAWMYMPEAFNYAHRPDLMLDWLKRKYTPVFNAGFDTLPETWCLYGEKTLGHWRCRNSRAVAQGAGLGLANAVVNGLCGISALEPGFKKVKISPCPGNLKNFNIQISGPDGYYSLAFYSVKNEKEYRINLPTPKPVQFVINSKDKIEEVFVNGVRTLPSSEAWTYNNEKAWYFELSDDAKEFIIKAYFS